jgi:hypothetical protein
MQQNHSTEDGIVHLVSAAFPEPPLVAARIGELGEAVYGDGRDQSDIPHGDHSF